MNYRSLATKGERGVVTAGTVRLGPLMALPKVLSDFGVASDGLLAEFGLNKTDFEDPETVVQFRTAATLLRRCEEVTGCGHIGLLLGQRATMSSLGAVGFLMQSSATVGDALHALTTHLGVHDRGAVATLERDGRFAIVGYRIVLSEVEAVEQIYTLSMLIGNSVMRAMCGHAWRAHEVQLPFRLPADSMLYRQAFEAPLRFDADRAAIVFPAAALDQPLATADTLLNRMMAERVTQLEDLIQADLVERSRRLLAAMIFLPHCTPALLAHRLGMSVRTMNRRLADERTSFQQLRDEACRIAACELLKSTARPASEIAGIVGYDDASSFTRAFRRWCGVAPAEWRQAQQSARRTA